MLTSVACVWVLLGTQSMASQRTAIVAQNFVAMCVGLGIAFSSDWRLSLVVLGVGPVLVLAGDLQMRAFTGQTQKVQKSLEKAGHVVEESVHGIRTVASFDLAEEMCQRCATLCMLPGRVLLTYVACVCCYGRVAVCAATASDSSSLRGKESRAATPLASGSGFRSLPCLACTWALHERFGMSPSLGLSHPWCCLHHRYGLTYAQRGAAEVCDVRAHAFVWLWPAGSMSVVCGLRMAP